MGGVYFVVRYLHNQTIRSVTTSRPKTDWNRVFFSFSLWSVFTIMSTLLSYYSNPDDFVVNFKPVPFLILFVVGVLLIPIQTSAEEYVFRGYLMQGFANLVKNKWFPLLMTSIIFGAVHFGNPEVSKLGNIIFVYYIGTGLFLGVLTLMDEGMELALGFHAANNLVGALLVTSDWSAFQTHSILKNIAEPTAGLEVILPVLVIYPLLLFIFSKKYQWTEWREKLTGKINTEETNSI
jgi:membrane protease YdiL (CAAX protease family)